MTSHTALRLNSRLNLRLTARLLGLAGLSTLLAGNALAQYERYYYYGIGAGQSTAQFGVDHIANEALSPGMSAVSSQRDRHGNAFKLFGGHQFNRNWALEGSYFDLGQFDNQSVVSPAGTLNSKLRARGVGLDVVGTLPFSKDIAAFARVGFQYARVSDRFVGSGGATVIDGTPAEKNVRSKIGAGLEFTVNPSFLVRTEIERYHLSDGVGTSGYVNALSLGLVFPFGRGGQSAPYLSKTMSYEAPVAVAPAPYRTAPMAVAAAQVPAEPEPVLPRRQVSFSAESLFAFDDATMRPEGKEALDAFGSELNGTEYMTITVEGHADRLGTTEYNQTLSLQRADAVKSYLVTNTRVDARKITTVGRSESNPVTRTGDCKGNTATKDLVNCLQPDRRVDIEVFGTR